VNHGRGSTGDRVDHQFGGPERIGRFELRVQRGPGAAQRLELDPTAARMHGAGQVGQGDVDLRGERGSGGWAPCSDLVQPRCERQWSV